MKDILKGMTDKKYIDNINGKILFDAIDNPIFAVEYCKLLNDSLATGTIPEAWKISTIVPVPKIAKTVQYDKYRPVNMLPIPEKVLETIVKNQMLKFIKNNDILVEQQSGFRENHSCETALNLILHEWKCQIENGKVIVAVFLDLRRAFETIDRRLLLKKLKQYGFDENTIKWFKDYLTGRKQQTKVGTFLSSLLSCDLGVPQGSILSALLFVLYMNDIVSVVNNVKINLFADDTLLWIACDSVEEAVTIMNQELEKLYHWLCSNKLSLNIEKTKAMIVTLKKNIDKNMKVKINNNIIDYVTEYKYLGVILDEHLNFNAFVD
jgi:hypothetical protein